MEIFSAFSHSLFSFILVLSLLVFVHEYGHYIVAKISGVKITTFSIGFGKEIIGWNDKSGTRWKISWLPLGGYVKMFGDSSAASTTDNEFVESLSKKERSEAFVDKPLWIKMLVVAAGPAANFLFAIVILTGFLYSYGKIETTTQINGIVAQSAAEKSGFLVDDIIIEVDGRSIETFSELQTIISLNTGNSMDVIVDRGGQNVSLSVTPEMKEREDIFGNKIMLPMLGISSNSTKITELSLGESFVESFPQTYQIAASTLKAIGQMVTGQRSIEEISGPIGIAKYSSQSVEKGLRVTLWFMVLLSINLGLINLLPIPLLDGGHLLYYTVEAVTGKPIADKIQSFGYKIGFAIIASLAVFAIVNDIIKMM